VNSLKLVLSLVGLLFTAFVGFMFLIIKLFWLHGSLVEEYILLFLIIFSLGAFFLLRKKPSFLPYIQVVMYVIILSVIFYIEFLMKDLLVLLWVYLTLFSSYILTTKKITVFLFIYSIILLFVLDFFQYIKFYDFLTLLISFIVFGLFLYINALIIENYEKDRIRNEFRLKELAKTDYLTGVLNRRAFFENASKMDLRNYAVLMLDIDYFKRINDTYGHDVGDRVLKEFTKVIRGNLRKEDIFARIGGEEFVILTKNIDKSHLYLFAEKLRKKVSSIKVGDIHISVSIGGYIAQFDEDINVALKYADEALYKAKKYRNKVVIK
jgi:diguanylate cyclase (GGDEF)-like protein